jgi:excisionase family DNA binding protein
VIDLEDMIRRIVREELARARAGAADEYLDTGAAARLASVTPDTIRKWCRSGKLTEHRAGERRLRVRRAELEQLLRVTPAVATDDPGIEKLVRERMRKVG